MIRRLAPNGAPRDRWMVSYLDMVTILLVFFVAAAARTQAPKHPEPVAVAIPIPKPAAEVAVAPVVITQPATHDELARKLAQAGMEVRREPRGLVATLPQPVLFAPGDDRVSAEALPVIGRIALILGEIPNPVIVVGHADAAPIHNRRFRSNWELSIARGMRVLELLMAKYHFEERRLSVSGDGSTRPAGGNDTPEGRALNRRVELVILDAPTSSKTNAETPSAALTNLAPAAD